MIAGSRYWRSCQILSRSSPVRPTEFHRPFYYNSDQKGNDFGESSYICDESSAEVVSGAEAYISGHSHTAFRAVLPYFIAAFKSGTTDIDWQRENTAVAWYRTSPIRGQQHPGGFVLFLSTPEGDTESSQEQFGVRGVWFRPPTGLKTLFLSWR
jgi:hypothetical protein